MKARSTQREDSAVARARQSAGRLNYLAWSGGIAASLEEARRLLESPARRLHRA